MKSRLQTAANLAVLLAAVLYVGSYGRQEVERYRHPQPPAQLSGQSARASPVGKTVSLTGVDFAPLGQSQPRTLVLAISATCHFCKLSEPFYQQLVAHSSGKVKIVAVLPQPLEEAQSYVRKAIAPSIQVVSSELAAIDVEGTPTVLLVDGQGKVEQAWYGKLDEKGQKQVQALVE